jgi:hypothetical protein
MAIDIKHFYQKNYMHQINEDSAGVQLYNKIHKWYDEFMKYHEFKAKVV